VFEDTSFAGCALCCGAFVLRAYVVIACCAPLWLSMAEERFDQESELLAWTERNAIEVESSVSWIGPSNLCQRGACSREALQHGQVLAKVPASSLLSKHTCSAPMAVAAVEQFLTKDVTSTPWLASMACVVLIELIATESGETPFAEYLQLLPPSEDVPWYMWDDNALALLDGTDAASVAREESQSLKREFSNAIKPVIADERTTFELYARARTLAASRASSANSVPCLAPICDMLNHATFGSDTHHCLLRKADDGGSEMVVERECEANAEILTSYGKLSNNQLLTSYAFAQKDNRYDRVSLSLAHVKAAALSFGAEMAQVKRKTEYVQDRFPVELHWDESGVRATLPDVFRQVVDALAMEEITAETLIHDSLQRRLHTVAGGSLEDDQAYLHSLNDGTRLEQALLCRIGEKALLNAALYEVADSAPSFKPVQRAQFALFE